MMNKRRTLSLLATNFLLCAGVCAAIGCDREKQAAKEGEQETAAGQTSMGEETARMMGKPEVDESITAVLLISGDEAVFSAMDADADDIISFEEFGNTAEMLNLFGAFEAEGQAVAAKEFNKAMFRYWDSDADGYVEPNEYLANAKKWLPKEPTELTKFAMVDTDKDGVLSEKEFVANLDNIKLFGQWDLNGDTKLSSAELVRVLRDIWDIDKDNRITVAEFGGPKVTNGTTAGVSSLTVTILNPVDYIGTAVSGDAKVGKVVGDRGFWLASNGAKVFAVVQPSPPEVEQPKLVEGQRIGFNGILVSGEAAKELATDLDPESQKILEKQSAFLSLYPNQLVVLGKEGG